MKKPQMIDLLFFFNDTATTEIYTLSLHDALPIFVRSVRTLARPTMSCARPPRSVTANWTRLTRRPSWRASPRSGGKKTEEDTPQIQARQYLLFRVFL